MGDPERKPPKQESDDLRKLIEGDKGPPRPIGQAQDEHERPDGPIGAVVKADYRVAPTDADEEGKATPTGDDRGVQRAPSGRKTTRAPGDPVKLRAELHDLLVKHGAGTLKPAEKGRILDLQAEIAEAETPA